ncbi:MAG: zf-HC2 domain-containing protein [bacterium]
MNPGHVDELYTAYIEETLTPAERERMEQHLRTCASCAAELAEIRQLHDDLRALPVLPLPAGFTVGVRERLRLQQPARQPFILSWRIAAFAGTLAATAIFALVLLPGKDAPSNIAAPGNTRKPAVARHTPEASATATVATLPAEQPAVEPVAKPPKAIKTHTVTAIQLPPRDVANEQITYVGRSSEFETGRKPMIDAPRTETHNLGTFVSSAVDGSMSPFGAPGGGGANLSSYEPVIPEARIYTLSRTATVNLNPSGPAAPNNNNDAPPSPYTATNGIGVDDSTPMSKSALPITVTASGLNFNYNGYKGSRMGTPSLGAAFTAPATLSVIKPQSVNTGTAVAQNLQDNGRLFASAVIPGEGSNVTLEMQGGRVNTVTATVLDATTSKEGERLIAHVDPYNSQRVNLNIADSDAPASVKLAFNNNENADKFYLFVPGKSQRANFVQNRTDLLNVRNVAQDFHGGKPIVSNMAQLAQESGMYILCPADFAEKSVTKINDAPALEQLRFLADNLNYRLSVNNQLCNITPVP